MSWLQIALQPDSHIVDVLQVDRVLRGDRNNEIVNECPQLGPVLQLYGKCLNCGIIR